jgi:hypothetical protein
VCCRRIPGRILSPKSDSPAEEEMLRDAQWMNALGAQGWELANIYRLPKSAGGWRKEWGDALVFCTFKRRVANTPDLAELEDTEEASAPSGGLCTCGCRTVSHVSTHPRE